MGDSQTTVADSAAWVPESFEEQTLNSPALTGMRSLLVPIQTSHCKPPGSRLAKAETKAPCTDTPLKTAASGHNFPPTWRNLEEQLSYTAY